MRKAADAFRSIGEVSKLIGVPPHVLRYWETQFPQLSPVKRADGRRYYRPEDLHLAAGLCELLREEGMTTRGAARLIAKDKGAALRARGLARLPERFRGGAAADLDEAVADEGVAAPVADAVPAGDMVVHVKGMADVSADSALRRLDPGKGETPSSKDAETLTPAPSAEPESSETVQEVPVESPHPTPPSDRADARPEADLPLFPGLAPAAPPPGVWLPRLAAIARELRAMTPPRRAPAQIQRLRDRLSALLDPDA